MRRKRLRATPQRFYSNGLDSSFLLDEEEEEEEEVMVVRG